MKQGTVNFNENDSLNGNFKASLFKTLFKERKTLLEGYPAVKKGLVLPEPCLKFGSSTYTFKTTEVVDKVACKHENKEFVARYKKDTGAWDMSIKQPLCSGLKTLVKYEERGGAPGYVLGFDGVKGPLQWNCKLNPVSGAFKKSWLYDCADIVKGVKLAGDAKMNVFSLADVSKLKWNVGFAYASNAGLTAAALNQSRIVTLNHSLNLDKGTQAIMEVAASVGDSKAPSPITVGVAHQYDKEHQIRIRGNQKGQVQVCVKKDFSPSLSVLFASCVDVSDPKSLTRIPAFGFKVATKC